MSKYYNINLTGIPGITGFTGSPGSADDTGATGITGPVGANGVQSGLTLYLNYSESTTPTLTPLTSTEISTITGQTTQDATSILYDPTENTNTSNLSIDADLNPLALIRSIDSSILS